MMQSIRLRLRVFLITFLLGLFAAPYLAAIFQKWDGVYVDLPISSDYALYVQPQVPSAEYCDGGGSGGRERGSLQGIYLADAQIGNGDFAEVDINNSDFTGAKLRRADFSQATVLYSSFIRTNLSGSDFSNAKLYGSDLTDSNLADVSFVRTNLSHSDLTNAQLKGANFRDANLASTNLATARGLTFEQVREALINYDTKLPSHLDPKRPKLIEQSRKRAVQLRKEMSEGEAELFFNTFDFFEAYEE